MCCDGGLKSALCLSLTRQGQTKRRAQEITRWRRHAQNAPGGVILAFKCLKTSDLDVRTGMHVLVALRGGMKAGEGDGEKQLQEDSCQPSIRRTF